MKFLLGRKVSPGADLLWKVLFPENELSG